MGTPACSVAPTAHEIPLLISEPGLEPLKGNRLGISPDLCHHGFVQVLGSPGLPAVPQTLMQFPDSIPEPGELQGTQFARTGREGLLKPDPVAQAASWV